MCHFVSQHELAPWFHGAEFVKREHTWQDIGLDTPLPSFWQGRFDESNDLFKGHW
jgi:hypothetical protein